MPLKQLSSNFATGCALYLATISAWIPQPSKTLESYSHQTLPSPPPQQIEKLNLNQATQEDLERLPGIGPKRAQSILALRKRLGRFHSVRQLLRIRGIGRKTYARLRKLVYVA